MSLRSVLLDLFLPQKCPFCQRFIPDDQLLCEDCEEQLSYTSEEDQNWIMKQSIPCMAPLWYQNSVIVGIKRYKFLGNRHYCNCFGEIIAEMLTQEQADQFDLISWVPLHRERFRERGYNQAELLGRVVAEEFDRPAEDLLWKWKKNSEQANLDDDDARSKNVEGVYRLLDEDFSLENLKILLVDDVITTGSTMESCVKVLKNAGAREVVCLGLARSRK